MIKRKNILKIAIDSPAAAGAGTLAKAVSKHYVVDILNECLYVLNKIYTKIM